MTHFENLQSIGVLLRKGSINASTRYYIFENFEDFFNLVRVANIKDIIYEEYFLDESCLVRKEHYKTDELTNEMKRKVKEHNAQVIEFFTHPYCIKFFIMLNGNLYVYIDETKNFETDPRIFANITTNPYYLERANLIGRNDDSNIIKEKIAEYEERIKNEGLSLDTDLTDKYRDKIVFTYLTLDFMNLFAHSNKIKFAFSRNAKKQAFIMFLNDNKFLKLKEVYVDKDGINLTKDGEDFFEKFLEIAKTKEEDDIIIDKTNVNALFYDRRKVVEDFTKPSLNK